MRGVEYLTDEEFYDVLVGEDIVSYLLNPSGYESFRVERLMPNFPLMDETQVTTVHLLI